MNLETYLRKKMSSKSQMREDRNFCKTCWQPRFNCFCHVVEKFDPKIEFVILVHPKESARRVATGRMSYLCLKNSHIIRGSHFPNNFKLISLLSEPGYKNIILAPGEKATNLSDLGNQKIKEHFPQNTKLRVYILDGTWSNVGKMFRLTPEFQNLEKYFFIPSKPSNIKVRQQPNKYCYSTLEAIHHFIELVGHSQSFDVQSRTHDKLLKPFQWIVEQQLNKIKTHADEKTIISFQANN